ncbi:MAG: hypothetical protein QNK04_21475 [Myxococcota bacterium]|nr:hypothetical protein [Myxococcota bacterium]
MKRFLAPTLALALLASAALAQPGGRPGAGQGRARTERTLWWNSPAFIESLSLSTDQREKMDAAWERFQASVGERSKSVGSRKSFHEALEQGRWEEARKALDTMADAARVPLKASGELKIAVLEQLSDEQRQKLATEHATLLRQTWSPRPAWGQGRGPRGGARGPR